jgi:hypothetical protein
MLDELEKKIQNEIDKDFPGVSRLKADFAGKQMPMAAQLHVPSVAEQLLSVAESVKAIHKEMDELQAEMVRRLDVLRGKLGSKA